jgi:glycosyltransferase involved in cell wall biosynthesis/2-polyprenyl-3-methyl-5-hydroxy-6-metoxy-1,4-benzoquinol methylase
MKMKESWDENSVREGDSVLQLDNNIDKKESNSNATGHLLEWTGERYLPWLQEGQPDIHYEHLHRYFFASQFVDGKRVLDLASGEGYGSAILAKRALSVVGVDIDVKSVKHASSRYLLPNLEFIAGSITDIPIREARCFDVITCFEALEHVEEQEKLLSEVKRLLKDDGLFILSSPNKFVYSDEPNFQNPYHLKELYFDELRNLLKAYFPYTVFLGQKIDPVSIIWQLGKLQGSYTDYCVQKTESGFVDSSSDKIPLYFLAIASAAVLPAESLFSTLTDLSEEYKKYFARAILEKDSLIADRKKLISDADRRDAEEQEERSNLCNRQAELTDYKRQLISIGEENERLQAELTDHKLNSIGEENERLQAHIGSLEFELAMMKSSMGWRIVNKYRSVMDRLFPQHSGRRKLYEFTQKGAKTILVCGPLAAWRKVAERIKNKRVAPQATVSEPPADVSVNDQVDGSYFKYVFEQTKKLSDIESFVPYRKHQTTETDLKLIAFYLPQFHPIPENDANWEKGFTEWTNVAKAVPEFIGHYQPHLPIDLGFYDLRLVETLQRQIELAKNYGIHGFCFHHYWFDGKGLMRTPVDNFLAHQEMDFKFCINWANENWTRQWDGLNQDVLLRQNHSPEDDIAFIKDTEKYLRDPRYIRIEGKPLLIVYHPSLLPDPRGTAERWRRHCREAGIGELYLVTAHSLDQIDPSEIGFDAAIEFAPICYSLEPTTEPIVFANKDFAGVVVEYDSVVACARAFEEPGYRKFRGVCPSWDNEPRRPGRSCILNCSTPTKYGEWLLYSCEYTRTHYPKQEQLVFINAWNEWAEGAHLEPDRKFGYGYLEATAGVLEEYDRLQKGNIVVVSHDAYEHGAQFLALNIVKTLVEQFNFRVVTILMGGGELQPEFEEYSEVVEWHRLTANQKQKCVAGLWARGFSKAICNTSVTGEVVGYLKDQGFTVAALIHELKQIMLEMNLLPSVQMIADKADTIVCASPVVADNFVSVAGLDNNNVVIRPQGIYYKNKFSREPARREIAARYDLPADAFIILDVGYGDARKGFDLFLDIGKETLQHHENAYFIWAGKIAPEMQEKFRALLDENDPHFIFPGFVKDVGLFYSSADVFLLTSREDPFPQAVLDALQSGLPVIGFSGAGGFCDLLESGSGMLVPYQDVSAASSAVRDLISDSGKRMLLSQQAKQVVAERFDFVDYVYDLLGYVGLKVFKVSAIIPNYNYERYLVGRIDSVANQTLKPYEIIFLDDRSTDNSVATAREALSQTGIKYSIIENSENQGCFKQWVKGISLARGDLIWMAEADDSCCDNFLAELVPAFEDDEVVISYANSYIIDEDSNILPGDYAEWLSDISTAKWKWSYGNDGRSEVIGALSIKNTIPNASAVVMRKSALGGIEQYLPQFTTSGDWFAYIYALQCGSICYNATKLNYYRRHEKSVIATNAASYVHLDDNLVILEYLLKNFDLSPEAKSRSIDFLNWLYKYILTPITGFPDIFTDPRYREKLAVLTRDGYGTGPVPVKAGS